MDCLHEVSSQSGFLLRLPFSYRSIASESQDRTPHTYVMCIAMGRLYGTIRGLAWADSHGGSDVSNLLLCEHQVLSLPCIHS